LNGDFGRDAGRIGEQHHRPMLFLEAVERLGGSRMMPLAVMHHAPDIANQRVMAGSNL